MSQILILSEYLNNKKVFIGFNRITASSETTKNAGLCPTRNKDKIVIFTLCRKEELNKRIQ